VLKRTLISLLLLVIPGLLLVGCGGTSQGESASQPGDIERGRQLFQQVTIGPNAAPGCITCHTLQAGQKLVGPSLAGTATKAAEYVQGESYTGSAKTPEAYLHESIVEPNAFVVEGFPSGVMYQNYEQDLSAEDIDGLVAFLMTLE
jgi:cytochrome c2